MALLHKSLPLTPLSALNTRAPIKQSRTLSESILKLESSKTGKSRGHPRSPLSPDSESHVLVFSATWVRPSSQRSATWFNIMIIMVAPGRVPNVRPAGTVHRSTWLWPCIHLHPDRRAWRATRSRATGRWQGIGQPTAPADSTTVWEGEGGVAV